MAKTVKLQELNRQYEFVCNEWIQKFCNKQQIDFDGWELFCTFVYGKNNRNL